MVFTGWGPLKQENAYCTNFDPLCGVRDKEFLEKRLGGLISELMRRDEAFAVY
jgi:hypothetical protein